MVRVRASRRVVIVVKLAFHFASTIRIQSTSFAPTALRMFASLDHDAIVASFHLIHGDERGRAPNSRLRALAKALRKFYRNPDRMITTPSEAKQWSETISQR
jgi:hypothetical protein